MQKKILGLSVVLLLALVMSACKDDPGGLPVEVYTGTLSVSNSNNYTTTSHSATLTLIGSQYTMSIPTLGVNDTGTYVNVLGYITFTSSIQIGAGGSGVITGNRIYISGGYGTQSVSGTLIKY
jgi:hypothetical protein